ncbi:N-acyl homoserine lactonase family protein [Brenneria izadpanahii]|uniref:N-acyl homoserine lactonase family protein n=2 Tax=Brenneria izadpanahii TaxID=2722756 RepID=A0ABX7UZ15_9GAMM|nr:N-acyl homoserine lactonase family protein [Brenneria izadpanahii]
MFQSGSLKCKLHNIKMNQGANTDYEIPVPFFLLTHPKGHTLIDGGNAVETAVNPRDYWGDITDVYWPVMSEEQGCVAQLEKLGIDPQDVRYVVQSHLHLDHTGAIGRFPNATYVVQRREYEYAYTADWFAAGGYIRNDFDRPGLKWEFLDGEINDFYDLYGDGSLRTIYTPGHSPGHQSVLLTLPHSGSFLLSCDAAYTTDHWEERALPGFLTSAIEAVRSVQKLRRLAEKAEATVVTGHDPDQWSTFKHAPQYYD